MSLKNAAKNFGFGRLRIGAQRRVQLLGQQGRAHVDLVRPGAQRQIALEPQMLEGEREDGEDRNGDAGDKSRRDGRRRTGAAGGPRTRLLDRLGRPASERRSEPNRPVPTQCFNWPHFE